MTDNSVRAVQMPVPAVPLALNAPGIPTTAANGGLRWEDLNDPASPVVVQIVLAPGTILLNDLVELSWQDEPAGSVNVNADHLSVEVITMPVDVADILEHPTANTAAVTP